MTNEERITRTALCAYREEQINKFVEMLGKATRCNKDNGHYSPDDYVIYMHKAMRAGIEAHDVNAILKVDVDFGVLWDRGMIEKMHEVFEERAAPAYERIDARIEDKALRAFHRNAYGE